MSFPIGGYRIMNANDNTFLYANFDSDAVLSVDASNLSRTQQHMLLWTVKKLTVNNKTAYSIQHFITGMWLYMELGVSWALVHATSSPANDAQFNLDTSNAFLGAFQIHPTVINPILQLAANRPQQPPTTNAWWELTDTNSKRGTWYFLVTLDVPAQGEVVGETEDEVSSEITQA